MLARIVRVMQGSMSLIEEVDQIAGSYRGFWEVVWREPLESGGPG